MHRLFPRLSQKEILLFDGAMGTELYQAGLEQGECGEEWNLSRPERVRAIHQSYVDAGADCLVTNTFQANPSALVPFGLEDRLVELLDNAARLARRAAGSERCVLLGVGPLYVRGLDEELPDWIDYDAHLDAICDLLDRQADALDGILFETWSTPRALSAVERLRHRLIDFDVPVILSMTYERQADGALVTHSGHRPETFARHAASHGLSALGVNCGREIGLDETVEILQRYRAVTSLPLLARPNAGTPVLDAGQQAYRLDASTMARWIPRLRAASATAIGGCCGTTPAHVAALRGAMVSV